MKWVLGLIVALLLAGCAGQDLSTPQNAFDSYQDAINARDYSSIKSATTESFRVQMAERGNDLKSVDYYFRKSRIKSAECKITLFEQDHPEKATIGCTSIYEYEDGRVEQSYKEEYFEVIKEEDGKWRVNELKEKK